MNVKRRMICKKGTKPVCGLFLLLVMFSFLIARNLFRVDSVEFMVRTSSPGGRFSPKNIGAIWVEDSSGHFVKTLKVWAQRRRQYLFTWNAVTGGNTVDAITSATATRHFKHTVSWDLTDTQKRRVANGQYKIRVEMTDQHSQGPLTSFVFPVNSQSDTINLANATYFHDMQLIYHKSNPTTANHKYALVASSTGWEAQLDSILADQKSTLVAGDTVLFVTDGGTYFNPTTVHFSKPVCLVAKNGLTEKPRLTGFQVDALLETTSDIVVKGLHLQGETSRPGSGTKTGLEIDDSIRKLVVDDCQFSDFVAQGIQTNDTVDSVLVSNADFYEIQDTGFHLNGEDNIYAKINNCSFWRCGRQAVNIFSTKNVEISHCTFFAMDGKSGAWYPETRVEQSIAVNTNGISHLIVRDNIFMKNMIPIKINDLQTAMPEIGFNDFWLSADTLIYWVDHDQPFADTNLLADPLFQDTSTVTFSLALSRLSPCVGAASDGTDMGDTRWKTFNPTSVKSENNIESANYILYQNYPNPFNPSTKIQFFLARSGFVNLTVFDILGRQIATLVNQRLTAGLHVVNWNADGLDSGLYYYRLNGAQRSSVRMMLFLK